MGLGAVGKMDAVGSGLLADLEEKREVGGGDGAMGAGMGVEKGAAAELGCFG